MALDSFKRIHAGFRQQLIAKVQIPD